MTNGRKQLKKLRENKIVKVSWIPGHKGHEENEIADQLAKIGSNYQSTNPKFPQSFYRPKYYQL